jgi:hypothetical protein
VWPHDVESFQGSVLFICHGTAVEHRSLLNWSVYIFSPQKRLKHGRQNITLHWINGIIRNNKCIFTKLNAVFILKTAAWTKKKYYKIHVTFHFLTYWLARSNFCAINNHIALSCKINEWNYVTRECNMVFYCTEISFC